MARLMGHSQICPVIEEFNIKNIVGCLNRKQFMFGYSVTTVAGFTPLTFGAITGGLIENLSEYECLVTKTGAANTLIPLVNKNANGITLQSDFPATYHLIFFGFGPTKPHRQHSGTQRWAQDYCPYCKAYKFKGLIGSIFSDTVTFALKATTDGAGLAAVSFRDAMQSTGVYAGLGGDEFYDTGQQKHNLVSQMADVSYLVAVTKSTPLGGVATVTPWVDSITKVGFSIHGDATQSYDTLVIGQIQY